MMTQTLPDIVRLGLRYRPATDLELRLFGDFTRWSKFEQHCILRLGFTGDELAAICATDENEAFVNPETAPEVTQILQRNWEDTFGVRLGGSYWFSSDFEGLLGFGYDGNAVPDDTLEPGLQDYEKFTASLGGRYELSDTLAVTLTATNVFYRERDTSDRITADRGTAEVLIQPPSRQPSSAGIYNQNIFLVSTLLELSFGGDSEEALVVEEEEEAPLHDDDHEHDE